MPEGASTAWCWCFRALTKSLSERVSLSAWQAGTSAERIYSNLWKKRIWLQQGIYTTHQSAGRERDNKGQTEREKRGGGVWFGGVVLLVLLNLHTDMHKSAHTQTFTQFFFLAGDVGPESSLVFQFQSPSLPRSNTWGGNWRWCHYPTAVPTTQCYTHAICTYDCVCVCACETLHWGQISLCLLLFNSVFVQDFGYPAHHVKSHGLDQVLSMWIRDTHKCARTHAHTVYSDCSCREWHGGRVGKGGETRERGEAFTAGLSKAIKG